MAAKHKNCNPTLALLWGHNYKRKGAWGGEGVHKGSSAFACRDPETRSARQKEGACITREFHPGVARDCERGEQRIKRNS